MGCQPASRGRILGHTCGLRFAIFEPGPQLGRRSLLLIFLAFLIILLPTSSAICAARHFNKGPPRLQRARSATATCRNRCGPGRFTPPVDFDPTQINVEPLLMIGGPTDVVIEPKYPARSSGCPRTAITGAGAKGPDLPARAYRGRFRHEAQQLANKKGAFALPALRLQISNFPNAPL